LGFYNFIWRTSVDALQPQGENIDSGIMMAKPPPFGITIKNKTAMRTIMDTNTQVFRDKRTTARAFLNHPCQVRVQQF